MKRRLLTLALAALTIGLLGSCSEINERIDKLESRLNGVENETIASINSQIGSINSSIADLSAIKASIQTSIQSLTSTVEGQKSDLAALEAADEALGGRIDELSDYVNGELANYAKSDWVNATFSTLKQYEETCDTIAKIDARIGALDTKLSQDIANCKDTLTSWINKQFESYYTIAEMDAKLEALQAAIDTSSAENKAKADSLAAELAATKAAIDTAKAQVTREYEAAIDTAITKLDGKLSKALQEKIDSVNTAIATLEGRVKTLELQVYSLAGRITELEKRIQSVSIIPAYSDGSVKATKDGLLYIDIIVEPAEAVAGLTKDNLKVLVNKVKTKAVSVDTVAVTNLKVDAVKGTVTARADISSKLPLASGNALTVAVNVKNGLSDYNTKFYPVTLSSKVEVKDEADSTKVTIKADADFPGSVMGNIKVEDLNEEKPTSIIVEGIGTVIFDKTATDKIKSNAQEAGATSVSFKVEDVTTTKPVQNADVVYEVTMKTLDQDGQEVFNKNNAAGKVTIIIPLEEDVVYIRMVTLVDDDGTPIDGGVVEDSIVLDLDKHTLTFQVEHFSKYAVGYVKNAVFISVTDVSLNKNALTLPVNDNETLVATVAPDNATNKKVTWTSSNTNVATVDKDGKVTAVAFGQATITVTTEDVVKTTNQPATATCVVTVTETKTMAELLATNPDIPEVGSSSPIESMAPPAASWINLSAPDCKAFIGTDDKGDRLFIAWKIIPGAGENTIVHFELCMDDTFERIDENTYTHIEDGIVTVIAKMENGKFISYEISIDSSLEDGVFTCLNGTYAPSSVPSPNPTETTPEQTVF